MSTIYRCDRCRNETKERDQLYGLELPHISGYDSMDKSDTYTVDLCIACTKEVIALVKPLAKVAV